MMVYDTFCNCIKETDTNFIWKAKLQNQLSINKRKPTINWEKKVEVKYLQRIGCLYVF